MEKYLSPAQAAEMIPGMSVGLLAQLRFTGKGPKFLKPTARRVVYRASDIEDWLNESERTSTAQGSDV